MITLLASLLLQVPDSGALARATAYAAQTDGQAVLVMHRGRIVHEQYMAGGSATQRFALASGSKSFVGVAALAAVADGKLQLDRPVADYLPPWRNDVRKSRITVRQLLSLESGLSSGNPGTGCGGAGSTWQDAINAPTFAEPGAEFRYGPFPFLVAGAVIEQATGESFERYLERRILAPLDVQVNWRMRCGDGKPQLAGGARMTARDWAVFGEFVRNGGVHQGKRLLPAELVAELHRPAHANPSYGLSWWLASAALQANPARGIQQADGAGAGAGRAGGRLGALRRARAARAGTTNAGSTAAPAGTMPTWLPADLFMAAGMGKQRLYVIPSRELVVVRLGPVTGGRAFSDIGFLEPLLGASR